MTMHPSFSRFSIRMRASEGLGATRRHISGAERIVSSKDCVQTAQTLVLRALHHENGFPEHVHLTFQGLHEDDIVHLNALPVHAYSVQTHREGLALAVALLNDLGIGNEAELWQLIHAMQPLRGAMLIDARTLKRLEPDRLRGVRASHMDSFEPCFRPSRTGTKDHFSEALVLASKVAHAPGIVAELCISDDPSYVTGYVASKKLGYCRISRMKEMGDPRGGRLFFYAADTNDLETTLNFLEKTPVLVHGIPAIAPHQHLHQEQGDPLKAFLTEKLERLEAKHLKRTLHPLTEATGPWVEDGKRRYLMLSSNDYLGLSGLKRVKEKAMEACERFGTGSGGSRLTSGSRTLHGELEEALARFKERESALLFQTGYQANLGTLASLADKDSVIISDALNHASIIDGARLSGAQIVVYAHNDMDDLEQKARMYAGRRGLIVSDAVFSMDGDILCLPEFLRIARRYGFFSVIDEAHATGVIGSVGHGLEEFWREKRGLEERADVIIGTLSKALGSEGGFVAGSALLITYLQNSARSFIFSTAPSAAPVAAALEALRVLEEEPQRVAQLHNNIAFFFSLLAKTSIPVSPLAGQSAIIPLLVGDEEKALALASAARKEGLFVQAIRYPTVPKGEARLRLTLRADHTKEDLTYTVQCLAALWRE